jgi:hypothetical protein
MREGKPQRFLLLKDISQEIEATYLFSSPLSINEENARVDFSR